jgi:hypothetical protein
MARPCAPGELVVEASRVRGHKHQEGACGLPKSLVMWQGPKMGR